MNEFPFHELLLNAAQSALGPLKILSAKFS